MSSEKPFTELAKRKFYWLRHKTTGKLFLCWVTECEREDADKFRMITREVRKHYFQNGLGERTAVVLVFHTFTVSACNELFEFSTKWHDENMLKHCVSVVERAGLYHIGDITDKTMNQAEIGADVKWEADE